MAEDFRGMMVAMERLQHAIERMARLGHSFGKEKEKLDEGNSLVASLGSAISSPDIVRSLRDALGKGMGGEESAGIAESVRRYKDAIQVSTQQQILQNQAAARVASAYAQAQPYTTTQGISAALIHSIRAGTITPLQANAIGGPQFRNIATQLQAAQRQARFHAARGGNARRIANASARRGRSLAMGPRGIPRGGGMQAFGNAVAKSGMGGMGTLAGSLFGPAGVAAGFAFDVSLKAVTSAFDKLNEAVGHARMTIDHLAVWSIGGMEAAITLMVADVRRQITMSNELSGDMKAFAGAQRESIKAWTDADIAMERLNFQFATLWADVSTGFARVIEPLVKLVKPDPAGALFTAFSPILGGLYFLGKQMGILTDTTRDGQKKDKFDLNEFTPWQLAFWNAARISQGRINNPNLDDQMQDLQRRLAQGGNGQPVPLGPNGVPTPQSPGGPGSEPWTQPQPGQQAPPPLQQNPWGPPATPPGGAPPPPPNPAPQIITLLQQILQALAPGLNLGGP